MSRWSGGGGDRPVQFVLGGPNYETLAQWRDIVIDQIIAQLEAGYEGVFLDDVGRYDELTGISAGEGGRMMMETVNAVVDGARQIAATRSDRPKACQTSGRFQVTPNHFSVKPGGVSL